MFIYRQINRITQDFKLLFIWMQKIYRELWLVFCMKLEKACILHTTFSIERVKDLNTYHETAKTLVSSVMVKNLFKKKRCLKHSYPLFPWVSSLFLICILFFIRIWQYSWQYPGFHTISLECTQLTPKTFCQ